jgi:hypothetical protein
MSYSTLDILGTKCNIRQQIMGEGPVPRNNHRAVTHVKLKHSNKGGRCFTYDLFLSFADYTQQSQQTDTN